MMLHYDEDLTGFKAWLLGLPEGTFVGNALPGVLNRPCPLDSYVLAITGNKCIVSPHDIEFDDGNYKTLPEKWQQFISNIDVGSVSYKVTREKALEVLEREEQHGN